MARVDLSFAAFLPVTCLLSPPQPRRNLKNYQPKLLITITVIIITIITITITITVTIIQLERVLCNFQERPVQVRLNRVLLLKEKGSGGESLDGIRHVRRLSGVVVGNFRSKRLNLCPPHASSGTQSACFVVSHPFHTFRPAMLGCKPDSPGSR